jgi:hypothetical protein
MKTIQDWPNYKVDKQGNVWSCRKQGALHDIGDWTKLKLTPNKDRKGYVTVTLCDNGKRKHCGVHRLVATAFIPNPDNLPEINHKNGDKTDNSVGNLEWVTSLQNSQHAHANGYRDHVYVNMQKPVEQLDKHGNVVASYPSINHAAKAFNTRGHVIGRVCRGKRKQALGFRWRFT